MLDHRPIVGGAATAGGQTPFLAPLALLLVVLPAPAFAQALEAQDLAVVISGDDAATTWVGQEQAPCTRTCTTHGGARTETLGVAPRGETEPRWHVHYEVTDDAWLRVGINRHATQRIWGGVLLGVGVVVGLATSAAVGSAHCGSDLCFGGGDFGTALGMIGIPMMAGFALFAVPLLLMGDGPLVRTSRAGVRLAAATPRRDIVRITGGPGQIGLGVAVTF